jgi:hypothetical protein
VSLNPACTGRHKNQVIFFERRQWAVLEDVAAILDIILYFLRTGRCGEAGGGRILADLVEGGRIVGNRR